MNELGPAKKDIGGQNFVKAAEQTRDVLKAYLSSGNKLTSDKVIWNRDYATRTIARGQAENNQTLVDLGHEINTLLDKLKN